MTAFTTTVFLWSSDDEDFLPSFLQIPFPKLRKWAVRLQFTGKKGHTVDLKRKTIEWVKLENGQWKLYIAKTEKGLCYVSSPGEAFENFESQLGKRFPAAELSQNSQALEPYANELNNYFNGTKQSFSLPVDIKGTPFQEEVWQALKEIPYGRTMSYSEIAASINRPSAVRAVGTAIGANPLLITVPCHRVIGKNGAITGYRGGLELKQFLLELENEKARIQ